MVLFYSNLEQNKLEKLYIDFGKIVENETYDKVRLKTIEEILESVGVGKNKVENRVISILKIISVITKNKVLRPSYNYINKLIFSRFNKLIAQLSFKPEDFSWLNELIYNLVETALLGKIIVNIEDQKIF